MKDVRIIQGNIFADDRGFVSCVNDFSFSAIKRFYMIENHQKNFTRAWHGHKKEEKFVFVLQGCAMVCAVPLEEIQNPSDTVEQHLSKHVLSAKIPQILHIPYNYANGFMTLEENTKILFFSTATLKESKNDDYRFEWNKINPWKVDYR